MQQCNLVSIVYQIGLSPLVSSLDSLFVDAFQPICQQEKKTKQNANQFSVLTHTHTHAIASAFAILFSFARQNNLAIAAFVMNPFPCN